MLDTTTTYPAPLTQAHQAFLRGVAHAFILHDQVQDFASPDSSVRWKDYLAEVYAEREIIVFYNPAEGIHFPELFAEPMEAEFRKLVGLDAPPTDGGGVFAALNMGDADALPPLPRAASDALPLLETFLKTATRPDPDNPERWEGRAVLIIEYAETILPDAPLAQMSPADRLNLITLARWGTDRTLDAAGNPIYLLVENLIDLHPLLRTASHKWLTIEIPLPNTADRQIYIQDYLAYSGTLLEDGLTVEALARLTAGLSYVLIEDVFLRAAGEGKLRRAVVAELKKQVISAEYAGLVEFIEPTFGYDALGGLTHVKAYMRRAVIAPLQAGDTRRVPKGILFTGPPGTGKSLLAEATAYESRVNMMNLRIGGNIASMWQGESERNLQRVLAAARQHAPVIIFIDEVDQAMRRGGGSSNQAENRIFQMLLEFMSRPENRGQIVFLLATNKPQDLDPALVRPGRIDRRILFPAPDADERRAILEVLIAKYALEATVTAPMLDATELWTGAELEGAVVKALEDVLDFDHDPTHALTRACECLIPNTAGIAEMARAGLMATNDPDLLPPHLVGEWERLKRGDTAPSARPAPPNRRRTGRV